MDLNRLRYFQVLSQCESMRQASDIIGISQSALSKAIKVLEQELDCELISPSGRGIVITEMGRAVSLKIPQIIQSVNALTDSENKAQQRIRMGSFEVFTTYFMGHLVETQLQGECIDIIELNPGALEKAVSESEIDFGITYLPIAYPNVEFLEVTSVSMGVFGKKSCFQKTEFKDLPFVVPIQTLDQAPTRTKGLDGWPDDRIPRLIRFRVTMMESALELCRRGLAVAYLPRLIVSLHNESLLNSYCLEEINAPHLKNIKQQPVYLVQKKGSKESGLMKKVAKSLRVLSRLSATKR